MGDTSRNHIVDIRWKPLAQDNTWKPEKERPGTGLLRNIHCAHWTTCLLHYPTHALALNYRQHNYQKLQQRWKSDRCALQNINLYNLKHAYRTRHHSDFTLVSPMGNTQHSPVCITQGDTPAHPQLRACVSTTAAMPDTMPTILPLREGFFGFKQQEMLEHVPLS